MAVSSKPPLVSIIIATLNSEKVLSACLRSIRIQTVKSKEIIIVDGGSTDSTLVIAKKYKAKIFKNPLKTAEAGKTIGIQNSKGEYISLIDSDNILPSRNWLSLMLSPLISDPTLVGSEPWAFTYRPKAGYIERYSSLTGVNDPYALIAGNYDRISLLHHHWTSYKLPIVNCHRYHEVTLSDPNSMPTIGANGTIYRSPFLKKHLKGSFFFDIDFLSSVLKHTKSPIKFAKVKTGIIHTYCEDSLSKFYRKQLRRSIDLYVYRHDREYSLAKNNFWPSLKFSLYVATVFPMLFDTVRGYYKKPETAWVFHPVACIITLYTYALSTIKNFLGLLTPLNRSHWQQ